MVTAEPNDKAEMVFWKPASYTCRMTKWTFLTNHARVLVCIAHDPGVRLRDIAATLDITERRAFDIVTDLTEAGYVVKEKDGRRNRYRIQADLPLRQAVGREPTIGEMLELLMDTRATEPVHQPDENVAAIGQARLRAGRTRRVATKVFAPAKRAR